MLEEWSRAVIWPSLTYSKSAVLTEPPRSIWWALMSYQCEKKANSIPATQAHKRNILPDSHCLFFCWFPLSHSISLGVDHRYFTALSLMFTCSCLIPPLPFFLYQYSSLLSLLFCDVLYKANITQSVCCMQNDHLRAFVLLKTREIFTKMFIYCTSGSVNWFASVYKSWY